MTNEEIAEQLYDELQHNKILNYNQFIDRLYELVGEVYGEKKIGGHAGDIENIMHNKWSFGFCDMCGEVIFYDDDCWYDLCGDLYDYEREKIEERLPKYQNETGNIIQDVCPACFNILVK